jgi:hypothetical protein
MRTSIVNGVIYVAPEESSDITPEILRLAEETHNSYFDDGKPIEWDDFIDRLCSEGYLSDGTRLDFDTYDNAAVRKIQKHVRAYRRLG